MAARIFAVLMIAAFIITQTQASKYEVIFERMEPALGDEDKIVKFETLRVKKFNHTTYVADGKYVWKAELDDTYDLSFVLSNLQGGQYKKMFERKLDGVCTFLYNDLNREYFEAFQQHLKYRYSWLTCPIPDGPNELSNYLIDDYASLMPPHFPGGEKWKMEVLFFKDGMLVGGYNVYLTLRTEKSLLNSGG